MSKHTPGPWWATKDKDARGWHGWRIDSDSRALMAWAAWPSEEERDSLEAESTARLIAAAPDLLAALRECITEDGAACLQTGSAVALFRRLQTINDAARAALAKARGE